MSFKRWRCLERSSNVSGMRPASESLDYLPVSDASRREDQNPLLVLLDAIARSLCLCSAGLRDRLVDSSHFD